MWEQRKWAWPVGAVLIIGFLIGGGCSSPTRRFKGSPSGGAGGGTAGSEIAAAGKPSAGSSGRVENGGGNSMSEAGMPGEDAGAGPGGGTKLPGETCTDDSSCESGHCADGVCCNSACKGACVACNQAASPGTCAPVAADMVSPTGHATCDKQAATSCGNDGMCDGAGACRKFASGTPCADGSCDAAANSAVTGASCDGLGTCKPAAGVSCAPFKCSGTKCANKCTSNTECVGQPCVNGSCGTIANSSVCTADAQCTSGHCIDGFCCNTACGSSCQACDLAGKQGVCSTVTAASKPKNGRTACVTGTAGGCSSSCDGNAATCSYQTGAACGTCKSCNAAGECLPVGAGKTDPACPLSVTGCAAGSCDGAGACKAAAQGTLCVDYTCAQSIGAGVIGQYTGVDYHKKTCNGSIGAANCKNAANEACGKYVCQNGADCKTSCSSDIDCTSGNYCNGGVCAAWVAFNGGCSKNSACISRLCDNGQCVECKDSHDCVKIGDSCGTSHKCECTGSSGCDQSCPHYDSGYNGGNCPGTKAPQCSQNTGKCACVGDNVCPPGTICTNAESAQAKCLAPIGMPCHAASDCAPASQGPAATCNGGVCQTTGCSSSSDCTSPTPSCCGGYNYSNANCSTSCS